MKELWKEISNACHYEVSNLGGVKSLSRIVRCGNGFRTIPECCLQGIVNHAGYFMVNITQDDGTVRPMLIHRIVALAFIPNTHSKPHINHIDGDKTNNRVSNLEWVTPMENVQHSIHVLGKTNKGVKNGSAKLSPDDVLSIVGRKEAGDGCVRIAKDFGIHPSYVYQLAEGRKWGHVTNIVFNG